jgi:hypothetical protein
MRVENLERLLFCLEDKTLPVARNLFINMSHTDYTDTKTKTNARPYLYDPPKVVMPPMDPKAQPVYYKLQLIADQDPIRGVTHTNQDGVTDIYWSVFDYFCVMYLHKTTDPFGRKKFEQINKTRNGEAEKLATRLKIRKVGTETRTMTADQLIDLSMMFKHPHLDMARDACKFFERVTNDYTKCAEVSVDEGV